MCDVDLCVAGGVLGYRGGGEGVENGFDDGVVGGECGSCLVSRIFFTLGQVLSRIHLEINTWRTVEIRNKK